MNEPTPHTREGVDVQPPFAVAADVFGLWAQELLSGEPPTRWLAGTGELSRVDLRPGRIVLIAGPPGSGKTCFALQLVTDSLLLNPGLRALFANCEIAVPVLLDRLVARLARIPLETVSNRLLNATHKEQLERGFATFGQFADRLAFLREPYNLANVFHAAETFNADLVCVDYLQRFVDRNERDERTAIDRFMSDIRSAADVGAGCFIIVSSCGRQRDPRGRTSYAADALSLASFRGSSEIEYASDDCYLLPQPDREGLVVVSHAKARHSQPRDLELQFDGQFQTFAGAHDDEPPASSQLGNRNDWGAEW